jgi:hypothetical protein
LFFSTNLLSWAAEPQSSANLEKYEAQSALLFFSKKRQLVSPLLSLDYRRTATVGSYWRGMGEAYH